MTSISISELNSLCSRHNVHEYAFLSYNQESGPEFRPESFALHFDTLVAVENDGMIALKSNDTMDYLSILFIKEILIDDSMPQLGITICIKCCSPSNSRRFKNFVIIAK